MNNIIFIRSEDLFHTLVLYLLYVYDIDMIEPYENDFVLASSYLPCGPQMMVKKREKRAMQ